MRWSALGGLGGKPRVWELTELLREEAVLFDAKDRSQVAAAEGTGRRLELARTSLGVSAEPSLALFDDPEGPGDPVDGDADRGERGRQDGAACGLVKAIGNVLFVERARAVGAAAGRDDADRREGAFSSGCCGSNSVAYGGVLGGTFSSRCCN